MRTFVVAIAMALVLAGCGGGSDPTTSPTKSTKAPTKSTPTKKAATTPTVTPTVAAPTGEAVPEALSAFRCAADTKGRWNASGYLTNRGKNRATYQVTVFVGEASGGSEAARTLQVPNVAAGGSTKFEIRDVPAPKAGGTCHVQVLAGN